jgi:hypothetical protein
MKIYTDDPHVHYIATTISPERTRDEISEILRAFDTSDILWHWKPDVNDVYVQFIIEEIIDGIPARIGAKVVMPTIWDKAVKNSPKPERRIEQVNLKVSMRAMHWYIKSHMETAYAMQSSRIAGFLPDMVSHGGRRFFDEMKDRLDQFAALENKTAPEPQREVITVKPRVINPEVIN